jgi:hypothetical protein
LNRVFSLALLRVGCSATRTQSGNRIRLPLNNDVQFQRCSSAYLQYD